MHKRKPKKQERNLGGKSGVNSRQRKRQNKSHNNERKSLAHL